MEIKNRKELFDLINEKSVITLLLEKEIDKEIFSTIIFERKRDTFYKVLWGYVGAEKHIWFETSPVTVIMNDDGDWMTTEELRLFNQNKSMYSHKSVLNDTPLMNIKPFIRENTHPSKLNPEMLIVAAHIARRNKAVIFTNNNHKDFYVTLSKEVSKKVYSSKLKDEEISNVNAFKPNEANSSKLSNKERAEYAKKARNKKTPDDFSNLIQKELNNVDYKVYSENKEKAELACNKVFSYVNQEDALVPQVLKETIYLVNNFLEFQPLENEEVLISSILKKAREGVKVFHVEGLIYNNSNYSEDNNEHMLSLHLKLSKLATELGIKIITTNKI